MGIVVLIAFLVGLAKLWISGHSRLALYFFLAYPSGLFVLGFLGVPATFSGVYFTLLTIVVWLTAKAKG